MKFKKREFVQIIGNVDEPMGMFENEFGIIELVETDDYPRSYIYLVRLLTGSAKGHCFYFDEEDLKKTDKIKEEELLAILI